MGFDFKKYLPINWKTKMPTDYEWEVHNLHAYKEKKEQITDTVWFIVALLVIGLLQILAIYGVFVK